MHDPSTTPFGNVLEMIGRTPMLELRRLDAGGHRLFGKMELMNPAGSIKDRIGFSMITAAERDGRLNPKGSPPPTIIEATAGNTGLALALSLVNLLAMEYFFILELLRVGLIFALLHQQYGPSLITVGAFASGIIFGLERKYMGTIPAIITHTVYNTIAVLLIL